MCYIISISFSFSLLSPLTFFFRIPENSLVLDSLHMLPRFYNLNVYVANHSLFSPKVKLDFLTVNGKTLESSRRPCMLHFKSEPIRILLTFLKIAPLITGYSLESQTLDLHFRGFNERDTPTACLRVTVEPRAEFRPGAGIPEIYAASLALNSELPLLKRILWNWKTTIFIWISMMMFCMELFFTLLCCKPIIIPRARLRGGSTNNNSSHNNPRIRR